MRVGLQLPNYDWPTGPVESGRHLAEIGAAADALGFESLWVQDHFFQVEWSGKPEDPMLDSFDVLSYLAAVTTRVRLGALVSGVIYRHPGLLVKSVTTLDVLSRGRAYFGIGAGWYEREALGLGVPFPSTSERFSRLEETLQIAKQMWSGEVGAFEGRYYQLAETLNSPPPVTRPHPPIMIGGMGEKKTLRLVARYGDACNLFASHEPAPTIAKLDILQRHCEEIGRPYEQIERTALGDGDLRPGQNTLGEVQRACRNMAQAGIQHLILSVPDAYAIKPLEILGREVVPMAKNL